MKWLLRGALVLLAFLVAAGCGYLYLRLSLPQTSGSIVLAGLRQPVEIMRDRHGIPHIFAQSEADSYFGLGFVHAQDRLWQMEMNRRIGSGRLSEWFGPATLDTDKFLRILGIRRTADAIYRNLNQETQTRLNAYAAGVNAYSASRGGFLKPFPPEFILLGVAPEPWTPADSIAWQLMMAWDLGGNWNQELLRLRLSQKLTPRQIAEFLPPYPGDAPVALPDLKQLYASLDGPARQLLAAAPPPLPEGAGSNNWVVAGSRSAAGKPLLANDPHLALTAPSVFYLAHLEAPGFKAIGATLPGIPTVVLGRNGRIAWGFTNTGPDVQDLFIEKIDPANPNRYTTPEGSAAFHTSTETIRIKGQPDLVLPVRSTRHGPVISDALKGGSSLLPSGYLLAFAWSALRDDDRTMQAGGAIPRARDWEQFVAALRDFHAPQQNIVYADVDGNIGFIAPGRIPLRKPNNDLHGLAPAPGWDARYDWAGFIPFEELPRSFNPASSQFATANNKIVPDHYAPWITAEWQAPYRIRRIEQLLDATRRHTPKTFAAIQGDVTSLMAMDFLPLLLKVKPLGEDARRVMEVLKTWDGRMVADRPEPLIVSAWLRELGRAVYADELGDLFPGAWEQRALFLYNVLTNQAGQGRWCDNVTTPIQETCAGQIGPALERALADLKHRYGPNMARWRWGVAHAAHSEHRPFGKQALLAMLFDIQVDSPGDTYTIDVGRHSVANEAHPFISHHAASLRAIYDFSDLDQSLFIGSTGQSGNPLSPLYNNLVAPWSRVEYLPMTTQRADIAPGSIGSLTLQPATPPTHAAGSTE